jgi:hypothetical protein
MTDPPHNDEEFRKQLSRKERSERILGLLLLALAAAMGLGFLYGLWAKRLI